MQCALRQENSPAEGANQAFAHSYGVPKTLVYCASHKNWIRNIRFSIMNRPLSQ